GHDRAPRAIARLPRRQPHGLHPVHLAGADPDDLAAAREDDGVRADKPADRPGKPEIAPLPLRGRSRGDDAETLVDEINGIRILNEEALTDPAKIQALRAGRTAPGQALPGRGGLRRPGQ